MTLYARNRRRCSNTNHSETLIAKILLLSIYVVLYDCLCGSTVKANAWGHVVSVRETAVLQGTCTGDSP